MQILSLVELPAVLPLGCYTGQCGSQAVLDELNATWRNSGSGVIFGQDTFGERFKAFSNMVTSQVKSIANTVIKTVECITCPNKIQVIESIEDLNRVPACMYIPILTMPEVRPLFEAGQLNGWGLDIGDLPQEDVVGRLLRNGTLNSADPEYTRDQPMTFEFKSGDPNYTFEELDKIETTRRWISSFLEEQLGPEGDHLDITDPGNRMGKLRKVEED